MFLLAFFALALDLPHVQQTGAGCGPAAVAMVMQYWTRESPNSAPDPRVAERVQELLPVTSPKGIPGKALKNFFEQNGFDAYAFRGEIADLKSHLAKGRPVIVCLSVSGRNSPLHYAVVVGLDNDIVTLNDPARGKLFQQDKASFLRAWTATGSWALLAVPRPA